MEVSDRPRTYGNWRRPQSAGLGVLGTLGTLALLVGMVAMIISAMLFGLLVAVVVGAIWGVGLLLLIVKGRHGRSLLQGITDRVAWSTARRTGANVYRAGPVGVTPGGSCPLPGIASTTRLWEARDGWDRLFAVIELPALRYFTVVFAADPDGSALVDQQQVDVWVAHWGSWLAQLGDEPGVVAAGVTIETAPDTGSRLSREVAGNLDPNAPAAARAMLEEVVATYPAGSATMKALVTITFNANATGAGRDRDVMLNDLAGRVPWLGQGLASTGAGAVQPVPADQLCELIRTAYEPAAARHFDAARAACDTPRIGWDEVGPMTHLATWDAYRHDEAASCTWAMSQAPRGEVFASVLSQLLRPNTHIDRKRVTILYRPIDSAWAAHIVEQDRRNADFRVAQSQRPSARALVEQRAAQATAAEEARGAGLVNFGMLVTATVTDPARLDDAGRAIEQLAPTAKLRLRKVYGAQDSAFAAALPLGLVPRAFSRVPSELVEAL